MYNYINLNFVVTSLSSLFLKFQNSRSFEKKQQFEKLLLNYSLFQSPTQRRIYIFLFSKGYVHKFKLQECLKINKICLLCPAFTDVT